MAEEINDAELVQLIKEYGHFDQRLDRLRRQLGRIGADLGQLSRKMMDPQGTIEMVERFHIEDVKTIVDSWNKALREKNEMEDRLTKAGMRHLIR